MEEKRCAYCTITKPITDFYTNKHTGKPVCHCKPCSNHVSTRAKLKRASTRDENGNDIEITEHKCRTCGTRKPIAMFAKNKYSKYGFDYECKECHCNRKRANRRTVDGRKRYWVTKAKSQATKKAIPFNITVDDIITTKVCPVLGIRLIYDNNTKQDNSPSLDRIIPGDGYVKGNVCVISERANRLKNDATMSEVKKILEYMESYVAKKDTT